MNIKKLNLCLVFFQVIAISRAILSEEIGKDLPTNYNNNDILARRRIPLGGGGAGGSSGCNFNGIRRPKATGSGRTFFDLQFFNVGYHQNYEINCGGTGGHPIATAVSGSVGSGGHKPLLGGHGGGGGQGGIFSNKPSKPILSMILGNRPLQGIFSQSQSQTQTQTGPHTTNKLPPGQYLVASHPLLGSYTQDLSGFDFLNPFKNRNKFGEEVADFLGSLFDF